MIVIMWGRQLQALIEHEAEHRATVVQLTGERSRTLGEISDLREQNLMLIRQMIDMKRDGFEPIVPVSLPPEEPEAELPARVEQAIRQRAEPGTELYHLLVEDAWRMLGPEGMDEDRAATMTLLGAHALGEDE